MDLSRSSNAGPTHACPSSAAARRVDPAHLRSAPAGHARRLRQHQPRRGHHKWSSSSSVVPISWMVSCLTAAWKREQPTARAPATAASSRTGRLLGLCLEDGLQVFRALRNTPSSGVEDIVVVWNQATTPAAIGVEVTRVSPFEITHGPGLGKQLTVKLRDGEVKKARIQMV